MVSNMYYKFIERLHTLYGLLQDEWSKIFLARLAYDIDPSISNLRRLVSLQFPNGPRFRGWDEPAKDVLKQLNRENKKIIIYGCGNRCLPLAKILQYEHIDFYGFCDRLAEKYPDGVLGKPVISPDELVGMGMNIMFCRLPI